MAAWDVWFPDVLVHARTAPDPQVRHALCRASREFFRRTRAWVEWLDPTPASINGRDYDFDLPAQTELLGVEKVTLNGVPMALGSYRHRASDGSLHPGGDTSLINRDGVTFTLTGDVVPGQQIQVQACLIPSRAAKGIPDNLAARYWEAISEGAKAELMRTPNTEYSRPDLAADAMDLFESAIASHCVDAYRGHAQLTPRARVHWC